MCSSGNETILAWLQFSTILNVGQIGFTSITLKHLLISWLQKRRSQPFGVKHKTLSEKMAFNLIRYVMLQKIMLQNVILCYIKVAFK